jgi:hypothetical protein
MLLPLTIGGALAIAVFLAWVRETKASGAKSRFTVRALSFVLVASHLVLSPLLLLLKTLEPQLLAPPYLDAARSLDRMGDLTDRTLVIVNAPDVLFPWWTSAFRSGTGHSFPAWLRVLGDAHGAVEVSRVDERSLRLRAAKGFAGPVFGETVTNPREPMVVGFTHTTSDLAIVVRELTEDGRPSEIDCRFVTALDDGERLFAIWTKDGYRPFELPPIGAQPVTVEVSWEDTLGFRY